MLEHGVYLDLLLQRPTIRRGIAEEGDDLDRCNSVSRMGRIVAAEDSVKREDGSKQSAGQKMNQGRISRLLPVEHLLVYTRFLPVLTC